MLILIIPCVLMLLLGVSVSAELIIVDGEASDSLSPAIFTHI
jgi:hypothetical protein